MTVADYDLVGSYNNQRISNIDAERSINLFEYIDPLGKKPKCLINTSGLMNPNINFSGSTLGFRAQYVFNDVQYCVIGNSLFRLGTDNLPSFIGTFQNTTTGYIGVDANTFQILFVDGVDGYIFDSLANTFLPITDTSFPASPLDCCFLDGFFVVVDGNTNNFQLSSFNQGMIWGPSAVTFTADSITDLLTVSSTSNYATGVSVTLSTTGTLPNPLNNTDTYYCVQISGTTLKLATSYANSIASPPVTINLTTNGTPTNTITSTGQLQQGSITTHPGTLVACRTLHRRIFFFCQFFAEVWENAGIGTSLPFRRNNSLLIEYGTVAASAVTVGFDIMAFLSNNRDGLGSVYQVNGTDVIPISTRALDYQLAQYAANQEVSDCKMFFVKESGLIFLRMNFTEANHTFVYNVTLSDASQEMSKLWHEEQVLNGDRHPAQTHAFFNGLNYVGDYLKPIIYIIDPMTYTNNGENIPRIRIGKAIGPPDYARLRIDRFQPDIVQGTLGFILIVIQPVYLVTDDGFAIITDDNQYLVTDGTYEQNVNETCYVFLSISKDGGNTYGNRLKQELAGPGNTSARVLFRKLGTIPRGQYFVPKIEYFNATPLVILGCSWAFEKLPE